MITDNGDGRSECICKPGYYYSSFNVECIPCPIGKYKPEISNQQECLTCPDNSWSSNLASNSCTCLDGYYRINTQNTNTSCIRNYSFKLIIKNNLI